MSRKIVTPIILSINWGTHKTYDWCLSGTDIGGREETQAEASAAAQKAMREWEEAEQHIEAVMLTNLPYDTEEA